MKQSRGMTFELIKSVLFGLELSQEITSQINDQTCEKIYAFARQHDLAHVVYLGIKKAGVQIPLELRKKFEKEQAVAVFRYERQNYELISIERELEKAGIDFMPLKGAALRDYYTDGWVRTSSDIDILVRKSDFDNAVQCLQNNLEYKLGVVSTHDISLFSLGDVHVELHYDLIEDGFLGDVDKPLQDVWETASLKEGSKHCYIMSPEFTYYYNLAHMAKHFVQGGCGIRPIMDMIVINSKIAYDKSKVDSLLQSGGLTKYAEQVKLLADIWFGGQSHTPLTGEMEDYILQSNSNIRQKNNLIIKQAKSGGKFRYAFSRIWLPYKTLKNQYPVLTKHKILYPFCQVARWLRLVFGGRFKRSMSELRQNSKINVKERDNLVKMLDELGFGAIFVK